MGECIFESVYLVFYVGCLESSWVVGSFVVERFVYGGIFLGFYGVEFCNWNVVDVFGRFVVGDDFIIVEDDWDIIFGYLDVEFDELGIVLGG